MISAKRYHQILYKNILHFTLYQINIFTQGIHTLESFIQ